MKTKYFLIGILLPVILAVILVTVACEEKDELLEAPRLFRPVSSEDNLVSGGNWLYVSWQIIKDAVAYNVDISLDTFKTIYTTETVDTNFVLFEDLGWYTLYQVQVQAIASDPSKNSRIAYLGEKRTAKYPSILVTPTPDLVTDVAMKVKWTNTGDEVTSIRVILTADSSLVKEVELTPEDIDAGEKVISGLTASTGYTVYIYSGENNRGWEDYTTRPSIINPGDIGIDLREINDSLVLFDTLPDIPDGSVVILKRGMTYYFPALLTLSKSVTVLSGYDFIPELATIDLASSITFASGSVIDSFVFKEVQLQSISTGYVFNLDAACTIDQIKFESCRGHSFRGFTRMKSSEVATINTFSINNCIIDSLSNYALITVDNVACTIENIVITNSTVYYAERFIVSRSNSTSVTIEACTFNQLPSGSNYFIYYRDDKGVTMPIKLKDCIIGSRLYLNNDSTAITVVRAGDATTSVDVQNTYMTADFNGTDGAVPVLDLLTPYDKPSTDLWVDPDPNIADFNIKDTGFSGKRTAGDPRWRVD